jgi:hypothetical protein
MHPVYFITFEQFRNPTAGSVQIFFLFADHIEEAVKNLAATSSWRPQWLEG